MNKLIATQIQQEIGKVQIQISNLERYKDALTDTLEAMKMLNAPAVRVIDRNTIARRPGVLPSETFEDSGEVPDLEDKALSGSVHTKERPNTLEMTKVVLENAGGVEKTVDELRELIRRTYGIEPAKSLDQMLYRRAAAGRSFYKTEDGRFGLSELRGGVTIKELPLAPTTVV